MRCLLLALAACGPELVTIQVGPAPLKVEVADSESERGKGLMHRDHLPADQGMLFVYPEARPRSFWMKDTRIPLSIAYVDPTGTIVRIADMHPFDRDSTKSLYPAKYAIEVNQGWFAAHGVEVGAKIGGIEGIVAE